MAAVTITGDKALDRKLATMDQKLETKLLRKAVRIVAKDVADTAKRLVPVDSGRLRRSIKVRAAKRSRRNRGVVKVRVTTGQQDKLFVGEAFYGGMVEFGTSKMEAQPFLRPAEIQNRIAAKSRFTLAIREIIAEEARIKT